MKIFLPSYLIIFIKYHLAMHNNKPLKPFRKALRNHSTSAEKALWNLLKGKQLAGFKFRRQHSVENYVLDFYCPYRKLAIELDGEYHNITEQQEHDTRRDEFLASIGIKVLRFENRFVFEHTEQVINEILEYFV